MASKGRSHDFARWNNHGKTEVKVDLFGIPLRIRQDPESQNLGTTVWDSSIIFAKWVEKVRTKPGAQTHPLVSLVSCLVSVLDGCCYVYACSARTPGCICGPPWAHHPCLLPGARFCVQNCNRDKADLSRSRVAGKRCLELGAGVGGLPGMTLAMLGADVVITDLSAILPTLERNVANNLSTATLGDAARSCGRAVVAECDWTDETTYASLKSKGPFDFIVGTECVYSAHLVDPLYCTVVALSGPRTTVVLSLEERDENVTQQFRETFKRGFRISEVPLREQHHEISHPVNRIYVMHPLRALFHGATAATASINGAPSPFPERTTFARDVMIGHSIVVELSAGSYLHGIFHDLCAGGAPGQAPKVVLKHVVRSASPRTPSFREMSAAEAEVALDIG